MAVSAGAAAACLPDFSGVPEEQEQCARLRPRYLKEPHPSPASSAGEQRLQAVLSPQPTPTDLRDSDATAVLCSGCFSPVARRTLPGCCPMPGSAAGARTHSACLGGIAPGTATAQRRRCRRAPPPVSKLFSRGKREPVKTLPTSAQKATTNVQ